MASSPLPVSPRSLPSSHDGAGFFGVGTGDDGGLTAGDSGVGTGGSMAELLLLELRKQTTELKSHGIKLDGIGSSFEDHFNLLTEHHRKMEKLLSRFDRHKQVTSETLEPLKNYITTTSRILEREVVNQVALDLHGEIVNEGGYVLKSKGVTITDIDGMVSGTWKGEDVIVFIEVKSSFKIRPDCQKALSQLQEVQLQWYELCSLDNGERDAEEEEEDDREDRYLQMSDDETNEETNLQKAKKKWHAQALQTIKDLRVREFKNRKVKFVIGSRHYSDAAKSYFRNLSTEPLPIFYLEHDPTRRVRRMNL